MGGEETGAVNLRVRPDNAKFDSGGVKRVANDLDADSEEARLDIDSGKKLDLGSAKDIAGDWDRKSHGSKLDSTDGRKFETETSFSGATV